MDVALMWVVAAVVVVIVVLAVAALVVSMLRRKQAERRHQAQALRAEAAGGSGSIAESQRRAEEARAQEERARHQAEQARERAEAARQRLLVDEAHQEDRIREADRVDPDVDTRADDYAPQEPARAPATTDGIGRTEAGTLPPDHGSAVPPQEPGGTHRA